MSGWIGVDLDGTLAEYGGWKGSDHIGKPIPLMVNRVKRWLLEGKEVRIFTARMSGHGQILLNSSNDDPDKPVEYADVVTPIELWCERHLGTKLKVTNVKDFQMIELWDDRCVQVNFNTGVPVGAYFNG